MTVHKRGVAIAFLAGLLVLSLCCGDVLAQAKLQMSLGGVTGSNYMIGAQVAKYVNSKTQKLFITPITSGGTVENLKRCQSQQAQLGMASVDAQFQAWNGASPFSQAMKDWRIIGLGTAPMANHVVTLAKSNIKVTEDLKGKTVDLGAAGSSAAVLLQRFLEHVGVAKDVRARFLPHQDAPTLLTDGKIDALARVGSAPIAGIEEIAVQEKVSLVDFGAAMERSGFLKANPYLQKVVVKGGTYKGEDRDVAMFGMAGFFIVHKAVADDVVYEFTKLAYSDECIRLVGVAYKGHNMNRKDPFEGNIAPVHPGAAKYWKEMGVKIPEPLLK